jgi:CHAT domain-containing protein
VPFSVPNARASLLETPKDTAPRRAPVLALLRSASDHFRAGRYAEAMRGFEATRSAAVRSGIPDLAARALGNVGSCQFALHQYTSALNSFTETVRQATAAGDNSAAAVFDVNIASLYSEMGELEAATQWIQGTLARMNPKDRREQRPKVLIQLATFRARQRRMDEARHLFSEGIAAADAAGDLELAAIGWNRLGEEYLKQAQLAEAEGPLLEAWRIRQLHQFPLDSSYRSLGRLRLEQGDLSAASALLDHAVELSARPQGAIPTWDVYHYRGRVRLEQGRLHDAVDDLRIAVRLAREWRWSAPPDDRMRIGAEGWLELVHSALVEAGNRLYQQTGDAALIRETFEAAEENRASSLRALVQSRHGETANAVPPEYWEALARLQRAEVQSLRAAGAGSEAVQAARANLARMEGALGPGMAPLPTQLLPRIRQALDGETVLLTFHLGPQSSWLWSLDRAGLALYELPGRGEIEAQTRDAAQAIRQDRAGAASVSARLCRTLFGQLPLRLQRKPRWLVALDGGLFETPLAALQDASQPQPALLIERHLIQVIPGAGYWLEARTRQPVAPTPLFVGVGDPIYNTADPRLPRLPKPATSAVGDTLPLPRLVSSAAELDEAAAAWEGEHVLLEGAAASRANLRAQLARNPAVVHFATHVVESGEQPSYGLIALSLTARRENQLVAPSEVVAWRTSARLVVLSGCRSGEGEALPGTGLLGLTRAWLAAGAGSVIASNWSTPDSSGALFGPLYRHLRARTDVTPSAALRAAQLEMIRSGGWRGNPRYWGAYFAVGAQ